MRTIEISEAALAKYGRRDVCLLTRRGKPIAAVVPIRPGMDAETFSLSHNAAFIESFNRSWRNYEEKGGIPLEEVERELAIAPEAPRKSDASRRPARNPVARKSRLRR